MTHLIRDAEGDADACFTQVGSLLLEGSWARARGQECISATALQARACSPTKAQVLPAPLRCFTCDASSRPQFDKESLRVLIAVYGAICGE